MSHNKMLIDATHPEETRVVVLRNGRVEEFDYESAARRLLRGSIFLAKVTRVEPSLQAAFVDYGGNRHGFLAFNEIHPDYYQIPHSDRQALLEEEEAEHRFDADDDDEVTTDQVDVDGDAIDADEADADLDSDDDDAVEALGAAERPIEPDDELDPEETAIDVSHLLPPEPDGAETVAAIADTGAADEPADNENSDTEDTIAEGDRKPPKTMAAKMADDERVVSEIVFPGPSNDSGEPKDTSAEADTTATSDAEAPDLIDDDAETVATPNVDDELADTEVSDDTTANDGVVQARGREENDEGETEQVEDVGNADAMEEVPQRRRRRARSYKIQEVIKRRQIVLIQVVKEERGNKGAALTTYLSLAGRYTVLMPNTARGGGISRKITNVQDRKRLKAIAQELEVPEGMGLIIRTAGAARTKQEIKRDFEYLLRLWENVRDLTLQSTAPSLVYEEGDLIKRSIRDLYSKDIDQILVAGGDAHKEAKSFMRMLMPSHAKNVIKYEDPQPLFAKYGIESQLNAMFSPFVQLRSGGYLVINQTEALVAVDVNSGKATKEFSIEETALKTNLEAAEELSRQLKLRDLAGLIVVDFIDMEEKRNNRSVERKLKECLRADRARIQVGRISHFGLLEMSRQRLRTGVLEGSTMQCSHCQGTGTIRSTESVALAVLRSLEDALMSGHPRSLQALTAPEVALYLLNHKRNFIQDMEARYGIVIHVQASDKQQGANFAIERLNIGVPADVSRRNGDAGAVSMDTGFSQQPSSSSDAAEVTDDEGGESEERRSRRRRRRRRRGDAGEENTADRPDRSRASNHDDDDVVEAAVDASDDSDADGDGDGRQSGSRRPRRRGRRGGRRNREQRGEAVLGVAAPGAPQPDFGSPDDTPVDRTATAELEPADTEAQAARVGIEPSNETEPTSGATVETSSDAGAEAPSETAEVATTAAAVHTEPANDVDAAVDDDSAAQPEPAKVEAEPEIEVAASSDAPDVTTTAPAASEPEDTPKPENDDKPLAEVAVAARRSPGASPVVSEPRIQRVVVRPGQMATGSNEADETHECTEQPAQKKGWWQRNFGG